jgi:predicted aminopeptidase
VEELGLERWLAARHDPAMARPISALPPASEFLALLDKYRAQLKDNYDSDASDADKRQRKAAIFAALRAEYATIKASWNGYAGYDRWFAMPLSNAHLALVGAYHDMVPAFRGCSKAVAFS